MNDDERLARALEAGDEGVRELERTRPDLAGRLAELQALELELARVGREDAALREAADRDVTRADRGLAAQFVRERVAVSRSTRWRPWILLAAAVVLLVTGIAVWESSHSRTNPPRTMLGSSGMKLRESAVPGEIAWEPVGKRYVVSVEPVAPAAGGTRLLAQWKQDAAQWSPSPEQRAAWPDRVRVRVAVLDDAGQETTSYLSLELSLSASSSH